MKVLKSLEDKTYQDMPALLESVGDETWDHD